MSRRPWLNEAEKAAIHRLAVEGVAVAEIARRLGRRYETVYRHLGGLVGVLATSARSSRLRTCLGCRHQFSSWGAGNRLCPLCAARAERAGASLL